MDEKKFVCKYCSKRFQCGKSLGGHIRTHMTEERRSNNANANAIANANANAECDDDLNQLDDDAVRMKKKRDLWCEAGYGLRENPKKTMRFVHSNVTNTNTTTTLEEQQQQQHEKFCKECGKGFASLKALCGHMACHSEKNKLVMDMDSESDTDETFDDVPKAPRRSKRMRFKTLSLSNQNGGSSSVSEVEQEQEEVARCLILLSKDTTHKGPFTLVTESSENNSVVVEEAAKSSPVDDNMRIGIDKGNNFVSNGYGYDLVENKALGLKSSDNSDSGYFRHGIKTRMAGLHVSNDELKSEFEDYSAESRKMLNMNKGRSKYTVTLFKKSVKQDLDYDRADGTTGKFDSFGHSKKTENGFVSDEIYETGGEEWKHENLDYDSTDESDEDSSDSDSFPAPKSHSNNSKSKVFNGKKSSKTKKKKLKSKKSKEHECPICYKIFKSGQALGGHKRSHFIGGSEENTVVIQQGAPAFPCFIDLNLPAPADE